MRRFLTSTGLLGLLLLGGWFILSNFTRSPAFNETLRKTDVYGREQAELTSSMYDYPNYLLQVATTYARADLLPSGDTEAQGEYATTEVAMARASRAVDLLLESVALDPANALAWEQLAWSLVLTGDSLAARKALGRSWALAPYNGQLARLRLDLALLLFSDDGPEDLQEDERAFQPTESEIASMNRDLGALQVFFPSDHEFYQQSMADLL